MPAWTISVEPPTVNELPDSVKTPVADMEETMVPSEARQICAIVSGVEAEASTSRRA